MHPVILMFTMISNSRAILGQDLAWWDNSVSPSSCMGSRTGTHLTYACHDVGMKDQSNLLQRLHDLHFTWPCLPLRQHFLTALHLQAMPWLLRVAAVNSAWICCKKNVVWPRNLVKLRVKLHSRKSRCNEGTRTACLPSSRRFKNLQYAFSGKKSGPADQELAFCAQAKKGVNAASQAASDVADSTKATASDVYNAAQKHGSANAKTAQRGAHQV